MLNCDKYTVVQTKERTMQVPTHDNVVPLRTSINATDLSNAINAIENAKQIKMDIADDQVEMIMDQITGLMTTYGIVHDNGRVNPLDLVMLESAIAAVLYRYNNLEHPLHEITDSIYSIEKE